MHEHPHHEHLPSADSILRLHDVRWGLNVVQGAVRDGDLDFSSHDTLSRALHSAYAGQTAALLDGREAHRADHVQLRIWRDECESLEKKVHNEQTQVAQLESEIERRTRTSAQRHEELSQAVAREDRLAETARLDVAAIDREIETREQQLATLQRRLAVLEKSQTELQVDSDLLNKLRHRITRIDQRIRKWRRSQQEVAAELVRIRESLIGGKLGVKPQVHKDLQQVREVLFQLEESAESLLDVVTRRASQQRMATPTAEVNAELDQFKEYLESAYNGLYHVHQATSKGLADVERERIEWSLRSLRRQYRDIGRCLQRLLHRRASVLKELAQHCPDKAWLVDRAQNGYCFCATGDAEDLHCDLPRFSRTSHPDLEPTRQELRQVQGERETLLKRRNERDHERVQHESRLLKLQRELDNDQAVSLDSIHEQIRNCHQLVRQWQERIVELTAWINEHESHYTGWLRERLLDASTLLERLTSGRYNKFVARQQPFRLFVRESRGTEERLDLVSIHDRDLASLALATALLSDWARLRDHVVWNVAFDRLRFDQAMDVARMVSDECPERLSLLVTSTLPGLMDRLADHGFQVLTLNTPTAPQVLKSPAPPTDRVPLGRAIVLRSNNSDSEEFPGEFRDQVLRGGNAESTARYLYQEETKEAYNTFGRELDQLSRGLPAEENWLNDSLDLEDESHDAIASEDLSAAESVFTRKATSGQRFQENASDEFLKIQRHWDSSRWPTRRWDGQHTAQHRHTHWGPATEAQRSTSDADQVSSSHREVTSPATRVSSDTRVRDLGIVGESVLSKFESEGVILVRDLLAREATELARLVSNEFVSIDQVRAWKRHATLRRDIKKLSRFDANVLVACGVNDAAHLKQLEGFELAERIEQLRRTADGQSLLRTGSDEELSRLNAWVVSMQESKRLRNFGYHDAEAETNRRTHTARSAGPTRSGDSARATRSHASTLSMKEATESEQEESLKFYLDLEDPVEAAPSIGPKMAEYLEAIGVVTIRDLLRGDADEIADQLDNRRAKADTVRAWQKQSLLVCRVPNLRGHDAQLLVACGIDSPEALSASSADELWSVVGPFSETREGAKIIRAGKAPDLEEVTDWVRWSQHQRMLVAA